MPVPLWDLLFLDLAVLNLGDMLTLYFHRQALMQDRKIIPLDLAKISFIGANAYIVNGASRAKVLDCLDAGMPINIEYDVYLSNQISTGKLKAAALFPSSPRYRRMLPSRKSSDRAWTR
jgi:hypothetical protein